MGEGRFWVVWDGKGNVTAQHESYEKAEIEARRLLQGNPAKKFYVLEAVAAVQIKYDVQLVTLQ